MICVKITRLLIVVEKAMLRVEMDLNVDFRREQFTAEESGKENCHYDQCDLLRQI